MAKKDPTDLSVEEKLKTLFQLQTALSSIDEKRALRGELPLRRARLPMLSRAWLAIRLSLTR